MKLYNGSSYITLYKNLYDYGTINFIGSYNSTTGFEITATHDGFFIVGGFESGNGGTFTNDSGFQVYTDYNGESNLNTINQDLLRIEDLLKDYLYGDKDYYEGTYSTDSNYAVRTSDHIIYYLNGCKFYQIKVRSGYSYLLNFQNTSGSNAYNINYYLLSNKITPRSGIDISSFLKGNFTLTQQGINEVEYVPDADGYLVFYTNNNTIVFNGFKSTYNEGQENGLYGGLTDINDQTKQQGEQTRETITSTDYNQNVVSVDTSSIDSISSTQTQGLFTTIFNSFNSAATGGVDSIIIPLPHGNSITLYSNVVSSHLGSLSALISAFWYFVFGLYAFKFVNNLIRAIKTGDILNGFNSSNEVISKDIL